ncbi:hypothetical protein Pth03_73950 [Planotetraspora thailandica]|uniref:NACHT domain-containing protein n=1 Tax=Planotetraspora thailandica TaxID=487172 RepID=A0A8J3Y1G4_9ACTN|nr:hypothetical protein Pth03_73950 [Planotetraspora thailandica]
MDQTTILGFGIAVVGLVATLAPLFRGPQPIDPTAEARDLAERVTEEEGREFKRLLGGDRQALNSEGINLRFVLDSHCSIEGSVPEGDLETIAAYYRDLRTRRLVITGADDTLASGDAGTGKTVLAVALVLKLIKSRIGDEPVPVRLSATSWDGSPLRAWLATSLQRAPYSLSKRVATALVDHHLVLPVIDGLDEMDSTPSPGYGSRADELLQAVDGYGTGISNPPVVLTCRNSQYDALLEANAHLEAAARIRICTVDSRAIQKFLMERVCTSPRNSERWRPILDEVASAPDGSLSRELNTPWRLTLAAVVYQERSTDAGEYLREPSDMIALASTGDLYEKLLDWYIPAAVSAGSTSRAASVDAKQVWRRLARLAAYLNQSAGKRQAGGRTLSGTGLVLHELWPMAGGWPPLIHLGILLLTWLIFVTINTIIPIDENDLLQKVANAGAFGGLTSVILLWFGSTTPVRWGAEAMRSRSGRRAFAAAGALGLFLGGVFYLAGGDWVVGLVVGLPAALGFGFLTGGTARPAKGSDPREPIRSNLRFAAANGLVDGAAFGGALVMTSHPAQGIAVGIMTGLTMFLGIGMASVRYFSFLLCALPQFPLRMGRFLNWCYNAGLLRVSGTAYQFRHRELQNYLAAHPDPPPDLPLAALARRPL